MSGVCGRQENALNSAMDDAGSSQQADAIRAEFSDYVDFILEDPDFYPDASAEERKFYDSSEAADIITNNVKDYVLEATRVERKNLDDCRMKAKTPHPDRTTET